MQVDEATIEHIINSLRTWLDADPVWARKENSYLIDLPIKNEENLELRFCATKNDTAIAVPNFVYLFNNKRIRGLDYHTSYIDCYGKKNSGVHEHKWSNKNQDNDKFPNNDFEHIPSDRQINYILKLWKIDYREQLRLELK
ncbi:MAG: hypothetical protein NTZ27_08340 [Ignavibacteriales bacterium]|nr:hypothetical protein [Ignavibacteriales bacterium]